METIRTPEKRVAFLAVLAETCQVGKACAGAGIGRRTAYDWREDDPTFAEAWDRAMRTGLTVLEDEMHRRAIDGTGEPVFHQGEQCGVVQKYSDTLAIFLAKAHAPEKYRDNARLELAGSLALGEMSEADIKAELATLLASGLEPKDGSDLV